MRQNSSRNLLGVEGSWLYSRLNWVPPRPPPPPPTSRECVSNPRLFPENARLFPLKLRTQELGGATLACGGGAVIPLQLRRRRGKVLQFKDDIANRDLNTVQTWEQGHYMVNFVWYPGGKIFFKMSKTTRMYRTTIYTIVHVCTVGIMYLRLQKEHR